MDLDAVADELYGLRPEEFVAARDRRALDARKAGDEALAKEIGALRRPSLAAWVSNLLVRRQRQEVEPLLELGEELRRAHRELDGGRLRGLARRQSEVIGSLGRQARLLAAEAGRPVGDGVQREVEETLHAVLADPEAGRTWAEGRLVKPLSATFGFPQADESVLAHRPAPPATTGTARRGEGGKSSARDGKSDTREAKRPRGKTEDGKGGRDREGGEDELARRRRLNEARKAVRDAERDLHARETEAEAAERAVEEARARLTDAEGRIRELRERLGRAEEEQRRAREEERNARERAREAARAVGGARRRAAAATAEAERLGADAGTRSHRRSTGDPR
ncbi:hypothetical protein [Streptomyces cinerochromogenes]|uniref:hypothetical protein n=1 Tax=Streptomyces cinerochromogenes TaxID=66422 RepID=UPI00166F7630|nr:hypothetical protein [Streptomyces cinerochromogenes]GGS77222.1 hypothetical protein GCM10010206_44650 [Streptomyces cinerochromogenes]